MTKGECSVAKIRVSGRGACYIPSCEIAELPEVKEMQKLAAKIVGARDGKIALAEISKEDSEAISEKMLNELPSTTEGEDFMTRE